jgi:hypothetical protein
VPSSVDVKKLRLCSETKVYFAVPLKLTTKSRSPYRIQDGSSDIPFLLTVEVSVRFYYLHGFGRQLKGSSASYLDRFPPTSGSLYKYTAAYYTLSSSFFKSFHLILSIYSFIVKSWEDIADKIFIYYLIHLFPSCFLPIIKRRCFFLDIFHVHQFANSTTFVAVICTRCSVPPVQVSRRRKPRSSLPRRYHL